MATAGGNERQWIERAGGNKAWSAFSILRGEFAVFRWTMCRCFSACISFIVWAAACRTSVLLCANLTWEKKKKKTPHQAHFVWLIGFPQWLIHRCCLDTSDKFDWVLMWSTDFSICPMTVVVSVPWKLSKACSCLQFNCFKNQSRRSRRGRVESWKKKRSFEERFACDPGLVIVSDFLAEKLEEAPVPSIMFFREISEGGR